MSDAPIKKPYTHIEMTPEMDAEYDKCMEDVLYFCRNYVYIQHPTQGKVPFEMWPYQEEILSNFQKNNKTIVLTSRQSGKCFVSETKLKLKSPSGEIMEMSVGDFYRMNLSQNNSK